MERKRADTSLHNIFVSLYTVRQSINISRIRMACRPTGNQPPPLQVFFSPLVILRVHILNATSRAKKHVHKQKQTKKIERRMWYNQNRQYSKLFSFLNCCNTTTTISDAWTYFAICAVNSCPVEYFEMVDKIGTSSVCFAQCPK